MTTARATFYGDRLREAREVRGFTMEQLGDLVGVKKQSISLYEKAKCQPAADTFARLVETLRVPPHFFYRQPSPDCTRPIFYRSMASATKGMRVRAEGRFNWFRDIVRNLSEYVEFPEPQVPDLGFPADPSAITDEQVDEAAVALRKHWGLGDGPISNVLMLLENKGVLATRYELGSDKLDAFSTWDDFTGRPLLVLSSDKESAVRSRFDAAHECGHLILHRHVPRQMLALPPSFNLIEEQAHLFARCFLLPEAAFAREHMPSGIAGWLWLKEKWKVSIGGLIIRAEELGLISETQARNLHIARGRLGWRKREPFDDEWHPEQPLVISRSVRLVIESGELSKSEFRHALGHSERDVEQLAVLPEGYFAESPGADEMESGPKLLPFQRPDTRNGESGQTAS